MEDGIIWDGAITWENGQIVDAGKRTEAKLPENCDVLMQKVHILPWTS